MDSKEKHVDWDGLVYYDGKIKSHIDDTVKTAVDDLNDRLEHESDCLHNQVTDVKTRVTIHDQDIRKLADEIGKVDTVIIKQEVTEHVINHFEDTIDTTVADKVETVLESKEFNTIVIEKVEQVVGTADHISYGSF